ncbi:hypothetical protein HK102_014199 [Quaeritorhiza haematococci]|nr:hypothetical protein HK102_014199 [Quaeritorhiza haematococci]
MLALCRSTPPPELARLYSISKAPRAAAVDECLRKVDLVISDACDPRRLEFMVRCLALGAINKHQSGLPFSRAQRLNELGELRIISWDRHSPAVPSFALRSILAVAFRSGLKRFILAGQSCVFLLDNPEDNDLFKPLVSGGIRRIHSESQQTEDSSSSSGTHSDSDFDWYSSMPVDLGQQNYALEHLELTRVTVVLPTTPPMGSDTKVSIVPPEIVAARQLHYTTTPLTPKDILRDRMKVHWPHLKTLILPNQKYILDDFLQAACETLQRLEHLELQSNVHLTGSGIVSGGSVLTCSSGHVRSALSDFASNSTALAPPTPISWPRLKHLNMDSCINLDPQFVSAVGRSCPQLEHLSLRGCALLQDWALEDILEWCKSLSHLDVSMCPGLTDGFLMRVCSAPTSPAGAVSTTMDTPRRFLTYLNVLHCNKILGQSKRDDDDDDDGFNDPARLLIQLALACPNLDQLSLNPHTHPSIKVCQAFEWRGWNSPQHQGNTAPPAAPPPPPPPPPQHAMRIPPADPQPQDPRSMLMRALNISRDLVEREEEQREKSVRVVTVSLERVRQGWKAMVRRECEMRGVGLREDEREGLEREMVGRVAWPGLLEFLSETT